MSQYNDANKVYMEHIQADDPDFFDHKTNENLVQGETKLHNAKAIEQKNLQRYGIEQPPLVQPPYQSQHQYQHQHQPSPTYHQPQNQQQHQQQHQHQHQAQYQYQSQPEVPPQHQHQHQHQHQPPYHQPENQQQSESEKETMELLKNVRCEQYYESFISAGADIFLLITMDDDDIKDEIGRLVSRPLHARIILKRVLKYKTDHNKKNGKNNTNQEHGLRNAEEHEHFDDDDTKQKEMVVQDNAPQYNHSQPSNSNLHYTKQPSNSNNQQPQLINENIKWWCLVEHEIKDQCYWLKYRESEQIRVHQQWKKFDQSNGNGMFLKIDVFINDIDKRRIIFNKTQCTAFSKNKDPSRPIQASQVSPSRLARTVIRDQPDKDKRINGLPIADDNGNPPFVQRNYNQNKQVKQNNHINKPNKTNKQVKQNNQNFQNNQNKVNKQNKQIKENQQNTKNVKPVGWCWWCNQNEKWIVYSNLNQLNINDKWKRFKQSNGNDFYNKMDVKENGFDMKIAFKKAQLYTAQVQANGTRFNQTENRVEEFDVACFAQS